MFQNEKDSRWNDFKSMVSRLCRELVLHGPQATRLLLGPRVETDTHDGGETHSSAAKWSGC